eukprot:scaffold338_cov361-Pavlova_lutheri.AAC.6
MQHVTRGKQSRNLQVLEVSRSLRVPGAQILLKVLLMYFRIQPSVSPTTLGSFLSPLAIARNARCGGGLVCYVHFAKEYNFEFPCESHKATSQRA